MKRFELLSFATADELARAAASAWLDIVENVSRTETAHHVALSGGRITRNFFNEVVAQGRARKISFATVHFFWADERCVPPDDPESNYRLARELLFEPLNISADCIHRIRGELEPEEAAREATSELCRQVSADASGQPLLDLIFLGLGEDGHVASLFPDELERLVPESTGYRAVINSPKPPPNRVTLGYPAIVAAREVWMLASGSGKAAALRESLSPEGHTPFSRVLKLRRRTKIFSDVAFE